MKDLLLCVHLVGKTLNLEISRCQTTSKNATRVRVAIGTRLFLTIQPIGSLFSGVVVAVAVAFACVTLRYVTLRYITLRYITLHYVTLRYVTLHSVSRSLLIVKFLVVWTT